MEVFIAKSKVPAKKTKLKIRRSEKKTQEIVIDRENGLVFTSEKDLYDFFKPQIEKLEADYNQWCPKDDIEEKKVPNLEHELDLTLDEPAEIWHDDKTFKDFPIFYYIRPIEDLNAFHVVVTYVSHDDDPTFIFLHFVTLSLDLVEKYRKGDLVYDKAFEEVGFGMLEGDSLSEGDPLAMGLFIVMLKVRSEKDIAYDKFASVGEECREPTIEEADEIWRYTDLNGNTIVTFIKEFPDHELKDLTYVAVTLEDPGTAMHTLLFSFPSQDENLIDRYRHGENLQADEVVQESSH